MSATKKNKRCENSVYLKKNGSRELLPHNRLSPTPIVDHNPNSRRGHRRNNPKNPPGILDWIIDFFIRPIERAIKELLTPIIGHPTETERRGLEETVEAIRTALASGISHSSPANPELTPASETKELEAWTKRAHTESIKAWLISVGVEMASLGAVDFSVQGYTGLPATRAYFSLAEEIFKAEFEIGRIPYLRRHWLKEYTPNLPGYADIISVYVREGYLAEKWVEIPPEFVDNMKELGYSEDWTRRLWGKHWVLPGVELLYDMFHKKIIDYDTLAMMLKFHDFEPVWRHRLIENAYTMIPRVDLRRAFMYGIPGFEDLTGRYEKIGYSPEDAVVMDQIAKKFALSAYNTRLLTVARAAFRKRRITEAGLKEVMVRIGLPAEAQALVIEAETLARSAAVVDPGEEYKGPSRTDIRWMVEWGVETPSALVAWLIGDGMDPEWAPKVAEAWLLNQLREELGKVRGVYEDLLEAGFMSKTDFEVALRGIHFAPHVIDALVLWAEEKLDLEEKKEIAGEYEKLAKEGVITVEALAAALRKLGMVEERITRKQNHIKTLLEIKAFKAAAKS